jgi:5-methyltetrahydropteroyltriglutamate--homocysteine methyltransferase
MLLSTERILTTHAGALPGPDDLLAAGGDGYADALRRAVGEVVRQQVDCGLDSINDGELGKPNFVQYVGQRISGFAERELRPDEEHPSWWVVRREERQVGDYFRRRGGVFVRGTPSASSPQSTRITTCTGPLRYTGQAALRAEIDNFRAALAGVAYAEAFLPAPSPGIVAHNLLNEYYPNEEAYLLAIADALHEEYAAITDAGYTLQIDSPNTADDWQRHADMGVAEFRAYTEHGVEVLNHALRGIPPDQVRFHMCWASWHGPHLTDIPLEDIVDVVLEVHADTISLEAANPRHEHEWRVWESVKLPQGKVLVPGVVGHYSDFVEHPRLIAERLVRYANLVGRENVIAGTDCGLSRVGQPVVAWAKFRAMAEGARLASEQLW